MVRPLLEVADILREHGPAWREANRGHVSLDQLKVMSAIEALPHKPVERPVVFFWLHAPAAERPRQWTNDQESSSLTASTSNITV